MIFYAAVAHLVERHLAKVEVASSSLVGRSKQSPRLKRKFQPGAFLVIHEIPGKGCTPLAVYINLTLLKKEGHSK